jgi:hypothetical protein
MSQDSACHAAVAFFACAVVVIPMADLVVLSISRKQPALRLLIY